MNFSDSVARRLWPWCSPAKRACGGIGVLAVGALAAGSAGVGGQGPEQGLDLAQVGVGKPLAKPRVEGHRRLPQPPESGLPLLRQLDHVNAAVGRVPLPGDQAARVHRVEVMRQRGLLDPHRLG
jgi:hypothetical protein